MLQALFIALALLLIILSASHYFFSPKPKFKEPCPKELKAAKEAGKRYQAYKKKVIDLINQRQQIKKKIESLKQKIKDCEKEIRDIDKNLDKDDIVLSGERTEAREKERSDLKARRREKQKAINELKEAIKKAEKELRDIEEKIRIAIDLEDLGRENYARLYAEYRKCKRASKRKKERVVKETEKPCCPSGVWIGVVGREGGELGLVGLESGLVLLVCADNPSVTAVLKWRGYRVGPGLGGEIGTEIIVFKGPKYPCQLEEQTANVMGGFGFDISIGLKVGDFLEALFKSSKKLPDLFKGAKTLKDKYKVIINELKNNPSFKEAVRDGVTGASGSAASSDFTGLTVPIPGAGLGVNLGAWWTIAETCELVSWTGCKACDGK